MAIRVLAALRAARLLAEDFRAFRFACFLADLRTPRRPLRPVRFAFERFFLLLAIVGVLFRAVVAANVVRDLTKHILAPAKLF
ncbi:MAG: hypothetical protein ACYDDA_04775 [Acidiferrobacteraceae bacterium]